MAAKKAERALVDAEDTRALRAWLKANHARTGGAWLVLHKKGGGPVTLTYTQAVEELLCFGWVDSKPNTLDEHRYKLLIAPRKPTSGWSRLNKERVERLIREGRMTPPGQAAVDVARENGAWDSLDAVENLEMPSDLAKALKAHPAAAANFEGFPRSSKRIILEWIGNAKKEETRAKRVLETATLAAQGIKANHWRQ